MCSDEHLRTYSCSELLPATTSDSLEKSLQFRLPIIDFKGGREGEKEGRRPKTYANEAGQSIPNVLGPDERKKKMSMSEDAL